MERVRVLERVVINLANEIVVLLDTGMNEKHYQEALITGLRMENVSIESERILPVFFRGTATGQYLRMDLVLEQKLILELKSIKRITDDERKQLARYMRVSGIQSGLLINFGTPTIEILRATLDGSTTSWETLNPAPDV